MDYEFAEKPKNKSVKSPYKNMFYMVVGICIVCVWAGWSILQNFTPSDEHMSSPEFIATETASILEANPEFVDWERYSDREIAIWLPDSYHNYPLEDFIELVELGSEEIPAEIEPFMDVLNNNPDMVRFVSFDMSTIFDFATSVNIMREQDSFLTLDRYTDMSIDNLPASAIVSEQPADIVVGDYKAKRFVLRYDAFGFDFTAIDYIVPKNGYFYTITFGTLSKNLDEMTVMTQKAMSTIRIYNHIPK